MKGGWEGPRGEGRDAWRMLVSEGACDRAQLLFKEELECGEARDQPKTARQAVDRDRDLTVKGSRHLTFNITVKLTIKES